MKIIYENCTWLCYQHNDQLPVGLVAQLVEYCTGIAEVIGSNPVEAWISFRPYFHCSSVHNCKIHFHVHFLNHSLHIWLSYIYSQNTYFSCFLLLLLIFSLLQFLMKHISFLNFTVLWGTLSIGKINLWSVQRFSMASQLQLW